MEGTQFGRYRLLDLLGAGGMGRVYRAHDTGTDRTVALKVLPEQYASDAGFRERFRREAHAAARLTDPHVVPIHDYGEIDGQLFLDMRLVDGTDLGKIIAAGPLAPADAVHYVEQVAQALDAAHRAGLLHRDVKPSNVIVTRTGFAYLIDFGIAKDLAATGITSTGATIGTFTYMAPERLGAAEVDARADVYALACVLHQALTGQLPFPGDSIQHQIVAHLNTPPPAPSQVLPGVPAEFDAVIRCGMAKEPDTRYATAGALAAAAQAAAVAGGQGHRVRTAPTVLGAGVPGREPRTAPTELGSASAVPAAHETRTAATTPGAARGQRRTPGTTRGRRRRLVIGAAVAVPILAIATVAALILRPDSTGSAIGLADATGSATPSASATTPSASATTPVASATTPTATPPAAAPLTTPPIPPGPPVDDAMANFVRAHYADLPADPASSWTRFTPAYQRRIGRTAHTEFWSGIAALSVAVTGVDAPRNRVSLDLVLTGTDGSVRREQRVLTLQPDGGSYLIAAAEQIN
ncbi:serine/threonine-protein kinase [Nocardia asteroides]|uniref:serine/threonine-protein kinase n=1 Tax=Nocardia asteroides TaxID=1824 RepID=UPI001E4FE9DB|nr:serine/threonine-protein kinase [Nocardia asteroides]UGT61174.1 serine/threonine protein kinase [Nocardia asteroides]